MPRRVWDKGECCAYCGETTETAAKTFLSAEELADGLDRLECSQCGREGCGVCMPGGNNCVCPECEAGEND